ncbi:MAG: ATP-dependent DNA helicase RecQ [Myxococcales bacterium]|nr:ATP-dependent DNA helicase [Polyangiaceae bacterium]MDW8250024.1 ATP-dependent DNA helicase RecQ [Myxococcales bacterium]
MDLVTVGSHTMLAAAYDPTADLRRMAREQFGIPAPFPWQEEAMTALMQPGARVLVVAPTGGGKSLCYQLPAYLLDGTALVVSPLISLMEDQVRSLEQRGIPATYLASTLSSEERQARFAGIRRGRYRLVYVAPERLSESIYDIVPARQLSLLAIDEAHCIVHWGQDFRPDYLRLGEVIQRSPPPRLLACTATATPATRAEILRALGLGDDQVILVLRGFARPNLALSVEHTTSPREAMRRADEALRLTLVDPQAPRGAGIVYAATRKQTEQVAAFLRVQGWRAHPYHAGLDSELRGKISRAFADQHLDVVVATNAFGMGIDRPDVRVVVHTQPPASIEAYYQEVGRAGRDGKPAGGLLCMSPGDIPLRRRLIEMGLDGQPADRASIQRQWGLFRDLLRYVDACSCRHDFILRYFSDDAEAIGGCGRCDVCRARAAEQRDDPASLERDALVVRKALAGVARGGRRGGLTSVCDMLRGIENERTIRFGFNQLTTFGLLREMNHDEVMAVLRAAVAAGYVDVTTGDFPVPFLTELGARVMRGETTSTIRLRSFAPRASRSRSRKARSPTDSPPGNDARLRFDTLRELRARLAKDAAVPPYVIAHDAALLAAAERNPKTLLELADIHGWGAARVARFGQAVLDALRSLAC